MNWDEMVLVGRIVRPHGNRGEVVIQPETDFGAQRFREGAVVYRAGVAGVEAVQVITSREHEGRWIVGLAGVASIDEAEEMRGRELRIPSEALQPLDADRHYVHDLIGCRVETISGRVLGRVEDVKRDTGVALLVVHGEGGEVLVPFTEAFCRRVDIAARSIVIDPPEGLVELNEARSQRPEPRRIVRDR